MYHARRDRGIHARASAGILTCCITVANDISFSITVASPHSLHNEYLHLRATLRFPPSRNIVLPTLSADLSIPKECVLHTCGGISLSSPCEHKCWYRSNHARRTYRLREFDVKDASLPTSCRRKQLPIIRPGCMGSLIIGLMTLPGSMQICSIPSK